MVKFDNSQSIKVWGRGKEEKTREEFEGREGVTLRYLTFLTDASKGRNGKGGKGGKREQLASCKASIVRGPPLRPKATRGEQKGFKRIPVSIQFQPIMMSSEWSRSVPEADSSTREHQLLVQNTGTIC